MHLPLHHALHLLQPATRMLLTGHSRRSPRPPPRQMCCLCLRPSARWRASTSSSPRVCMPAAPLCRCEAWGCPDAWVAVGGCCLLLLVAGCPCHPPLAAWACYQPLSPPSPLLPVLLLGQLRGGHRGAARQVNDAGGGAPAGGQVCGRQEERHPGAAGAQAGAWSAGADGRLGEGWARVSGLASC